MNSRKAPLKKPVLEEEKVVINPYPQFFLGPGTSTSSEKVNEEMRRLFDYQINSALVLESVTGTPFIFQDELHYEALGSYVAAFVHCLLKELCNLQEVWLPSESDPHSFCVFQSSDWTTNRSKAMVLIPGKGKVSLGQWSRNVCMNSSLAAGSMLNYISQAISSGYAVLVMNCNARNSLWKSNEENAWNTWRRCAGTTPSRDIFIVAHSWGGHCTLTILKNGFIEVARRVLGIAFTDSVHKTVRDLPEQPRAFLKARAVNWVRSKAPVDTVVASKERAKDGCENRSSGNMDHEYTSAAAISSVFQYFDTCVRKVPSHPGLRRK